MKLAMICLLGLVGVQNAHAQQKEPTLLTVAPDGWRFERLDFPLRFAPDLKLDGYEEIRFAPGMFDPKSDSYFSYAMVMLIRDRKDIDVQFLQDLFQKYYVGLCDSVGKSRKLKLDVSRIKTQVEQKDNDFHVTVSMYDAFVTGKPLTVNLKVSAHHGESAAGLVLLVLASPADPGEQIWEQLDGFRSSFSDDEPSLRVMLNHFFVIPDQETFDAIAASKFLKEEFSVFEERTTVRRDMTYTGIYFYGKHTYFEFLPPGGGGMPAGASGIAFGVETVDETDQLRQVLETEKIQSLPGSISRELDNQQIPWFRSLGIQQAHADSSFSMFAMEYQNEFLKRWHPDLPPKSTGIARQLVLERYASHVLGNQAHSGFLFEDIFELNLRLDRKERDRLVATLKAFGYSVRSKGNKTIADGPDIKIVVTASKSPGGIIGFKTKLAQSRQYIQPFRFGNSQLEIDGNIGNWTFETSR